LGNFFTPFFGIKSRFWSERVGIRKCVFIKHGTTQFQHTHELVHGFTIKNLLITLLRVQIELTLHGVHDAACEVVLFSSLKCGVCKTILIVVIHRWGSFDYLGIIGRFVCDVKRDWRRSDHQYLQPKYEQHQLDLHH